ncbi:MAG: peptide/nickel transport system permease protein [Actinomycetota bacterium]|nr:peptide/nickel transport system permease protein [Actinomycetota bacterium]
MDQAVEKPLVPPRYVGPGPLRRTARGIRWLAREAWKDKVGLLGLLVVGGLLFVAIAAPLVAPHDPTAQSLETRLMPPFWLDGGSLSYPLGTDALGRDILSRVIFGSRTSLLIGVSVVLVAGAFGTLIGLWAGYKGGRTDSVLMRIVDTQVSFPGLLIALLILAVIGASAQTVIIALSINGWMVYARLVRGLMLSLRESLYVEAAEVIGCKPRRVIFRHMLPNLSSPLLTLGILEFARIILAEAGLSFLGFGIQPPATSWGLDVSFGRDYMFAAWWLVAFPGMAISVTVLGVNLLASWLRIIADPQERDKRFARGVPGGG